jgi:hypothetical protein
MFHLTKRFLSSSSRPNKSVAEVEHQLHFPDLAPNDFWLFPKIKSALKRRRFQNIEDILTALKAVPEQEFQNVSISG